MQDVKLSIDDHDRDKSGMTYVYPVVSRRARGVSIGVNLNPNNACNWRCVYCQVPGLTFGNAPQIDVAKLESELRELLSSARSDEWMRRYVPAGARRLADVAISGNGEPTSSRQLPDVVDAIERVLRELELRGTIGVVLISNGSLVHLAHTQAALEKLAAIGGEVWIKLDSASEAGQARINGTRAGLARARENLATAARLCPTWIQTLALEFGQPTLAGDDVVAYCELLNAVAAGGARLRGVLLYGLARPSHQPEAGMLRAVAPAVLESLGQRIARATGLAVRVDP